MDKIYQGKSGTSYMVAEMPLASGGEGSVYAIHGYNEFVLKVFKQDRRTREREEKLLKMVEYRLDEEQLKQITWPQDVVYDQSGFVGYVMPRLWENRNLNVVYSTQNNQLDLRHRMLIAYNLCAAIDTVHSLNQVCGDLNPQNICVNLNLQSESALRVTLVDTDSYHIMDGDKTYRCEVGLANYLAPEIQNKLINGQDLKSASLPTFTKETDLFALAVHIFSLIMNGCHPFACAKQTNNGYEHTMEVMNDKDCESVVLPQPIDNIKEGFFPFHQERSGVTYPLYAPDFKALPQELQGLFIRAFENGYHNPKERPTTEEWMSVLCDYINQENYLQCRMGHFYFNIVDDCPYCEAKKRMKNILLELGGDFPQKKIEDGEEEEISPQEDDKKLEKNKEKKKFFNWMTIVCGALVLIFVVFFGLKEILYYQTTKSTRSAMENQNYVEAIEICEKALKYKPTSYVALENMEECYLNIAKEEIKSGKYTEAKEILEKGSSKILENHPDVYYYPEKLSDYQYCIDVVFDIEKSLEKNDYISALCSYSFSLEDKEEFSDLCEDSFGKMKKHLKRIIKKIKKGEMKNAYKLYVQFCEKYGNYAIWYVDDKITVNQEEINGKGLYLRYGSMYFGEMSDGEPSGDGIEIGEAYSLCDNSIYYVSGTFKNGYANGICNYFVSKDEYEFDETYSSLITGNFTDGFEDGEMTRVITFLDSGMKETFKYIAEKGTYSVIDEDDWGEYVYSISENGKTLSTYSIEDHTLPNYKY